MAQQISGEGLYYGYYDLFTLGRNRTTIPNVIILLTDGRHNGNIEPIQMASRAKNDNILIYSVGIGSYDLAEISAIASDPDERFVFTANTFVQLVQSLHSIADSTCNTPIRPFLPPTLLSPIDGEFFTAVPELSWQGVPYTEPRHDGFFEVSIYEENGTTPLFVDTTTELSMTPVTTLQEGRYLWTARGGNAVGLGPYARPGKFTVSSLIPATGMHSPAITQVPALPVLNWDHMTTAEWYNIVLRSDNSGEVVFDTWISVNDLSCGITCQFNSDTELLRNGNYTWYMRGYNRIVGVGPWSNTATLIVNIPAPGRITRIAPVANATILSGDVNFQWEREPNATWYNIVVKDANGQETINRWYKASDVCVATTCTTPALSPPFGTYEWQMRGWGPGGIGPLNALWAFTFGPPPPGLIERIQPAPDAVILSGDIVFVWNTREHALWYNVVAVDADGAVAFNKWYEGSTVCNNTTGMCQSQPENFAFGVYNWYMRGWGLGGFGDWDRTPFNFRSGPVPPGPTTQLVPDTSNPAGVIFQWQENTAADWYNVVVEDNLNTTISNEWYEGTTVCSSGICAAPAMMLASGDYVWRLGSWNQGGLGDYSSLNFNVP